jgi:hypothetical protein
MRGATVQLAAAHAIVTEGLMSLLQREFALVGTVADGAGLIEAARRPTRRHRDRPGHAGAMGGLSRCAGSGTDGYPPR